MTTIKDRLGLRRAPVAVAFLDAPPVGMKRWDGGAVPAGCTFWQKAMQGASFYTLPEDHLGCAVGCHTHHIPLPPERAHELQDTVGFMVKSGYLRMEEVPGIPTLRQAPGVVAYAPVEGAPFVPDVVLLAAQPAQAMLVYEAALRAGAGQALTPVLGRPGCAVLPLTLQGGTSSLSFGCKGNRVFTGTPDDEMYVAVPGARWAAVALALDEILRANATMEQHYRGKLALHP
ncbi:MAG: DUF169 domain-containing protein [Myxococcota bacterium]